MAFNGSVLIKFYLIQYFILALNHLVIVTGGIDHQVDHVEEMIGLIHGWDLNHLEEDLNLEEERSLIRLILRFHLGTNITGILITYWVMSYIFGGFRSSSSSSETSYSSRSQSRGRSNSVSRNRKKAPPSSLRSPGRKPIRKSGSLF